MIWLKGLISTAMVDEMDITDILGGIYITDVERLMQL